MGLRFGTGVAPLQGSMGRAKSILDQQQSGILGGPDTATMGGNAYQNITGDRGGISGTPDWFQAQRSTFYAPTELNKENVDLYTSTAAQAQDWRNEGQKQYEGLQKQYGFGSGENADPWIFRGQSEGGLGIDPTKYNLLGNLDKKYAYRGDLGANATLNSRYGGQPGLASQRLEAEFNPLTGQQEGAFDLMNTFQQGPAVDQNRRSFGNLANSMTGGMFTGGAVGGLARQGYFGGGLQRGMDKVDSLNPMYGMQEKVVDKIYGAASPSQQRMLGNAGNNFAPNAPQISPTYAYNNYTQQGIEQNQQANLQRSAMPYARQGSSYNNQYQSRFNNPYNQRRNPYGSGSF